MFRSITRGKKSSTPTEAQFHNIQRFQDTGAIAEAYTLTYFALDLESDPLSSLPESTPSDLRAILTRYRQVLDTPKGLPMPRPHFNR